MMPRPLSLFLAAGVLFNGMMEQMFVVTHRIKLLELPNLIQISRVLGCSSVPDVLQLVGCLAA